MDDAEEAAMGEQSGVRDPPLPVPLEAGCAADNSVVDAMAVDDIGTEQPAADRQVHVPPHSHSTRTQSQRAAADASMVAHKDGACGFLSNEEGVKADARLALAALTDDELIERVKIIVTSNPDGPMPSGLDGIGGVVLVDTCVRLKLAVNKVYEAKKTMPICRSPERPDLALSQEEAYGRAMVDLIRGKFELVPKELRDIGKKVDTAARREKETHEKVKAKAKDKKKNARTYAKNNEAKAASLDETIAAIDTDVDEKRIARLLKQVDVDLPAENTVVVESKPKPAPDPVTKLMAQLRETMDEADATVRHKRQELDKVGEMLVGAKAKVERLIRRAMPKGKPSVELLERMQAMKSERDDAVRALQNLQQLHRELGDELLEAADEGDAAARQLVSLQRKREEELRAAQERLCEGHAKQEAVELHRASLEARLAAAAAVEALDAAVEPAEVEECRVRLERAAVRADLSRDAERAWGAQRGTPRAASAGKVFKLSGLSWPICRGDARASIRGQSGSDQQRGAHRACACGRSRACGRA